MPVLGRYPLAPDHIESQHHEPNQRLAPPPFVPHLLQHANRPVGPLHMIVGPDPLVHRIVQVGHDLGELVVVQLLQGFDQLGHGLEGRIVHDRGPAAARLVVILGRVEQPMDPVGELPQGRHVAVRAVPTVADILLKITCEFGKAGEWLLTGEEQK